MFRIKIIYILNIRSYFEINNLEGGATLYVLQNLSSLNRDWNQVTTMKALSPNHGTTRQISKTNGFFKVLLPILHIYSVNKLLKQAFDKPTTCLL